MDRRCEACEAEGRDRSVWAKGLCSAHYTRLRTTGTLAPSYYAKLTTLEERLTAKSRRAENGCLEWTGRPDSSGAGRLDFQGEQDKAYRWAWRLWIGPIPEGMCILHGCDNRLCIDPNHLELDTKRKNNVDAWLRGRQPRKLTVEQIVEIRQRYAQGGVSQQQLADELGVRRELIGKHLRYSVIVDGAIQKA